MLLRFLLIDEDDADAGEEVIFNLIGIFVCCTCFVGGLVAIGVCIVGYFRSAIIQLLGTSLSSVNGVTECTLTARGSLARSKT